MAMEKENYRPILETLLVAFQDDPFPSLTSVAKYLHKNPRQLKGDRKFMKMCKISGKRINIAVESLAVWLCGN